MESFPRENGKNIWDGKPGALVSVSPGALSAFGANHHLRQSLIFLNIPTMQQPEAYIGNVATLFDESGALIDERTRGFLQNGYLRKDLVYHLYFLTLFYLNHTKQC